MKKVSLSLLISAFVASSITLLLLESPLKYILYFFEVALILIVCYSLFGKTIKTKFETRRNTTIKLDYAFLATSTILLVLTALKLDTVLTMVCAIIVSFFLPGYVLLRLLRILGKDATLEGRLSFDVNFGDEFTVTTNFEYTGKINTDEYRYYELNVLYQSLPIFLLTGILFIAAYASVLLTLKKPEPTGVADK